MKIKEAINSVDSISLNQALEYFSENASKGSGKKFVINLNPEIIMLARKDKEYENVLKSADLKLNDGVGVSLAAKIFGKKLSGRVAGADLTEKVCEAIAKRTVTVGFLGGKGDVAEVTAKRLVKKYSGLKVAFALEEWPASEGDKLKADILFVAFGSPKQEKWILENLPSLRVKIVMGVGGTFDFISGKVRRAPLFIRKIGFEWLFRLIVQPWRLKRQLGLIYFLLLVVLEKIGL
jgi:N-acetylglucosaminyldiphosphoundecaprenol N-acetyl-beta-D-mannosaminyltransferase